MLKKLDDWLCQCKSRSVSIIRDDGYGASAWMVTVTNAGKEYHAWDMECPEEAIRKVLEKVSEDV